MECGYTFLIRQTPFQAHIVCGGWEFGISWLDPSFPFYQPMGEHNLSISSAAFGFYLFVVDFDVALTAIEGGHRPHVACVIRVTQGFGGQTFDSVGGDGLSELEMAGLKMHIVGSGGERGW